MIDWDDLRIFLSIHRAGTLARAASALSINATTVSRRLTNLETRIEARLFDRTPDGYVLTLTGRDLLPRAERMEAEALGVAREVSGRDQKVSGVVRLSVTEMLATRFLAPHLPALHAQHPALRVDLECTNRTLNLRRRETDIALRLSRPREEEVITKRLADVPLALYAAREYLERHGKPDDPERSLSGHSAILFAASRFFTIENEWFAKRLDDARVALRADSVSSIYAAAVAGLGIALLPRAVADRDPRLTHLQTDSAPEPRAIYQAVHKDLSRSARVRAVLDFLSSVLEKPNGRLDDDEPAG